LCYFVDIATVTRFIWACRGL